MQKTKRVKNPGKQRKRLFNAPAHIRHKLMSAPLSSELAASRGAKTLPVRKGDTVRIMRGDNKGFEGKVSRVALKEYRIYMEGLTREKVDGTNIFLPIHPSKVQIRNLNLDDKWRKDILTRKKAVEKPEREAKAESRSAKESQRSTYETRRKDRGSSKKKPCRKQKRKKPPPKQPQKLRKHPLKLQRKRNLVQRSLQRQRSLPKKPQPKRKKPKPLQQRKKRRLPRKQQGKGDSEESTRTCQKGCG